MKKTIQPRRKLALPKQVIRRLDTLEVKEVRGGAGAATVINGEGNCQPSKANCDKPE